MLSICNLLKRVKIEPILARGLSISNPVEDRIEKKWTQRRMKRHKYERIRKQRAEEFAASEHFRYEKEIARNKNYVDK